MIWQMIEDWFRGILTDGILSNLSGLFDSVNTEVGEIATQVGTTPAGWNAGIFNMIRSLSENVIVPIAGVIITFVMCYELIQLNEYQNTVAFVYDSCKNPHGFGHQTSLQSHVAVFHIALYLLLRYQIGYRIYDNKSDLPGLD